MAEVEEVNVAGGIRRGVASRVFLELAASLKADPVLDARVITWIVPGRPEWLAGRDDFPRAVGPDYRPTLDECPLLRLMPEPRDGQPLDNVTQQATLTVGVGIWIAGHDPLDLIDYWECVQRAVGGEIAAERDLRKRLAAVGAVTGEVLIEQPILGAARDFQGNAVAGLIGAQGSMTVTYKIGRGG